MRVRITRRGVLAGAAAIAGASAVPQVLRQQRAPIAHVVVDERLPAAAAFAAAIAGARVQKVNALADLCHRWYTQLRPQVLAVAAPVAGLTTWMDFVVMRDCAAEIGYRTEFHAEHVPGAAGLEHRVSARPELLRQLLRIDAPTLWPQALGAALARGAHLYSRSVPGQIYRATTADVTAGELRMISWVFSPRLH
jgi:hypothetical protein